MNKNELKHILENNFLDILEKIFNYMSEELAQTNEQDTKALEKTDNKLKEKVELLKQEFNSIDENKKKMLLDQIFSIDFELINSLYENTKKEFANKIVNIDINLNEFGVYVVTYYFETKENMFQKIMIKLKRKVKKNKTALLQSKFEKYSENQYGKYKETKTFKPY